MTIPPLWQLASSASGTAQQTPSANPTMAQARERQFTQAMLDVYRTAVSETTYTPKKFLRMVNDDGGLATAQQLLRGPDASEGFYRLLEERRLDLTVEALVLQPAWRSLFTTEELDLARARLKRYDYQPPWDATPAEQTTSNQFPPLRSIVEDLNRAASRHPIGRLQQIRKELKPGSQSGAHVLFDPDTDWVQKDSYAYHHGGRNELQFNVGFEEVSGQRSFRHGAAFSLERSQYVRNVLESLLPRIARFNEFIRLHPEHLVDLEMWYWKDGARSASYPVRAIEPEIAVDGAFIMIGRHTHEPPLNVERILSDLDRLLPLFRFVQGNGAGFPALGNSITGLYFTPGHRPGARTTAITLEERALDVHLRHAEMQTRLYQILVEEYGPSAVGTEQLNGPGNRVDVVVRLGGSYTYYEIKTSGSARGCIREGLSQLLEYSYWPSSQEAERLVLVGESPPSAEDLAYLSVLRERFRIPIHYKWLDAESGRLR